MPNPSLTKKNVKVIQRLLSKLGKADTINEDIVFKDLAGGLLALSSIENKDQARRITELLGMALSILRTRFPGHYPNLIRNLYELSPSNEIVLSGMIGIYMDERNISAMMDILVNHPEIELSPAVTEMLRQGANGSKGPTIAAKIISERRVFDQSILEKYLEHRNQKMDREIISNYLHAEDENLIPVLKMFYNKTDDLELKLKLIELLVHSDSDETQIYVKSFPIEELRSEEDCEKVCGLFKKGGDAQSLEGAMRICLKMYPENPEILKIKGDERYKSGKFDQALSIYLNLIDHGHADEETVNKAIGITYNEGRYRQCLELIQNLSTPALKENYEAVSIRCKMNLLQLHEALDDIENALHRSPDGLDLLTLKLEITDKTRQILESYDTANRLLILDPNNRRALDYLSSYYLEGGEFGKLIEILQKSAESSTDYAHIYCAALIMEGKIKQSIDVLRNRPDLFNNGMVLDAIYARVRGGIYLDQLSEILGKMGHASAEFELISRCLHGDWPGCGKYDDLALETSSIAVMYLVTASYYTCYVSIPDTILQKLRLPEFEKVWDILKIIEAIGKGRPPLNLYDYPELGYPVCNALLDSGLPKECERLLSKYKRDESDSPYMYVYCRLMLAKGEFREAGRIADNMNRIQKNLNFDRIRLIVDIENGEREEFHALAGSLQNSGNLSSRSIENLHAMIENTGRWEFADLILDVLGPAGYGDVSFQRLSRHLSINRGDTQKATELSGKIISSGNWKTDDIRKHVMLLQTSSSLKEILNFLEDTCRLSQNADVEVMLGNLYYDSGSFSKAYLHYSRARDLGLNMSGITKYAEVLLEMNRYDEASGIIGSCGDTLLLAKFYGKTQDIPKMIGLVQKIGTDDKNFNDVFAFIIENFWDNPQIRYEVIKRYINGDYGPVGLKIIEKCLKENDVKTALGLSRDLFNKQFSFQASIYYSQALYLTGEHNEAKRILSKTLNKCQDEECRIRILEALYTTLYKDGDYDSIVSLFTENQENVNTEIVRLTIESHIQLGLLDEAEKIADKFYETMIDKKSFSGIKDEIRKKREFMETAKYAADVLRAEYKAGKKLRSNEEFYAADVPIDKIDNVRNFLRIEAGFVTDNETLERISSKVVPKLVKNEGIREPANLAIYLIYNSMDNPDPVIARELYFYIRNQIEKQRIPLADEPELKKLAKTAMKNYIGLNPFIMSSELGVGISKAMDVITLLRYLSEMESGSES